jgi:hypothetical protein
MYGVIGVPNPHDERDITEVKSLLRRLEVVAQGDDRTLPGAGRRLSTGRAATEPEDYYSNDSEDGSDTPASRESGQSFGAISLLVANVVMATATITSLGWYLVYSSTIEGRIAASSAAVQIAAPGTAAPQKPVVNIAPPREVPAPVAPAPVAPAPIVPAAPVITAAPQTIAPALDESARRRLVARGEELVGLGQINSARLAFERAAAAGSAEAAISLGDTYDPRRLLQAGAPLNLGDVAKATYWYERADELGSPDAKSRIMALAQK